MEHINWHSFFFYLFALVTCVFSIAVVVTGNIVRMAFYLIVTLGATAGLFFMAGASFVGAMQLMIYVGGTLVLLIFGVMLTAQGPFVSMKTKSGEWVLAVIVGGSLLAVLVQAAFSVPDWLGDPQYAEATAITGSPSRPHAQVIVRPKESITDLVGVPIDFRPWAEPKKEDSVRADYDSSARKVTVLFRPGQTTAEQVKEALEQAGFDATLPAGSRGNDYVTAKDDTQFAIRAPRGDTPPGQIGLAFLGFRTDDAGGDAPRKSGYLLPFEIISVHLLVVLIAAAYLARTKKRVNPQSAIRNPQ